MLNSQELTHFDRALGGTRYDRLPIIFSALSDPKRCKIARLLISKGDTNIGVTDISKILNISQSSASQHLKVLEITGLVQKTRAGRNTYFNLNESDPIVQALARAVLEDKK